MSASVKAQHSRDPRGDKEHRLKFIDLSILLTRMLLLLSDNSDPTRANDNRAPASPVIHFHLRQLTRL